MYNYYQSPYVNAFNTPYGAQNSVFNAANAINGTVLKVSGKNGANALNLAPNTNALALDETAPILWYISADSAGYKTLTPYDIAPHKDLQAQITTDLETRVKRLEELINDKSDIKSNGNAKRTKSANDTTD